MLTAKLGDLRWSTSTYNRRRDPLSITEISLTPAPASIALPAVRWWKLNIVKGNLPAWVAEDLARADKTEYRSRGEMRVHNMEPAVRDAADEYEQIGRDHGLLPPAGFELRTPMLRPGRRLRLNTPITRDGFSPYAAGSDRTPGPPGGKEPLYGLR